MLFFFDQRKRTVSTYATIIMADMKCASSAYEMQVQVSIISVDLVVAIF